MTTEPSLRRLRPDEFPTFLRQVDRGFFEEVNDEDIARWEPIVPHDRFLVAESDGEVIGTSGSFRFELSLPGGASVGCAGVTMVTVRSDHRRRGVLRRMMAQLLADARDAGEPFAALYASEGSIYGRFGFGPSVPVVGFEMDRAHATPVPAGDASRVRLVDVDQFLAAAPDLHARWRRQRGGVLARSDAWWDMALRHDTASEREGGWSRRYLALLPDGGYAVYRGKAEWTDRHSESRLRVEELVALDPAAYRDLWTFLASVDLMATIQVQHRPPDDPLPFLVADRARVRVRPNMSLWLRLIDLPGALTARAYTAVDALVLDVADASLPDNAGRWRLETGPDGASCDRVDGEADVILDTADLATVALGGVRAATLADAGRIRERTPGAVTRLDRMLAVDRAPATSFDF